MSIPPESLAGLLQVEPRGEQAYTATLVDFWGAPLPADVWARVALAAATDCPEGDLISLQGLLPDGLDLAGPLSLRLEAAGDGSVPLRHVEIVQADRRGRALAVFAAGCDGPSHQDVSPSEVPPDPESLPTTLACARAEGWPEEYARGPVEFRRIGPLRRDPERGDSYHHLAWLLPRAPWPRGAESDVAALVFAASWYPHWEFERRLGPKFAQDRLRVLDHSLRIHEAAAWTDWWLLETRNEVARHGRALSTRRLFDRRGRLLASSSTHALAGTT